MSQAVISIHGRHGAVQRLRLRQRLLAIGVALLREWQVRRDLAILHELGSRGLHDIGIGPGAEESAVRHGRRRFSGLARATHGAAEAASEIMPPSWTEWR